MGGRPPAARTELIPVLGPEVRGLPPGLPPVYQYLIEERGDQLGRAVSALAAPGALPALVHCAAGKDRTGIVIGLVLAVLGVPDDIIAAEDMLTLPTALVEQSLVLPEPEVLGQAMVFAFG